MIGNIMSMKLCMLFWLSIQKYRMQNGSLLLLKLPFNYKTIMQRPALYFPKSGSVSLAGRC